MEEFITPQEGFASCSQIPDSSSLWGDGIHIHIFWYEVQHYCSLMCKQSLKFYLSLMKLKQVNMKQNEKARSCQH